MPRRVHHRATATLHSRARRNLRRTTSEAPRDLSERSLAYGARPARADRTATLHTRMKTCHNSAIELIMADLAHSPMRAGIVAATAVLAAVGGLVGLVMFWSYPGRPNPF